MKKKEQQDSTNNSGTSYDAIWNKMFKKFHFGSQSYNKREYNFEINFTLMKFWVKLDFSRMVFGLEAFPGYV